MARKNKARRGGGGGSGASSNNSTRTTTRAASPSPQLPCDMPPLSAEDILGHMRAGTLVIAEEQMIGCMRIERANERGAAMDVGVVRAALAADPQKGAELTKHLLAMVDHFGESSAGTLALFDRYGRPGVGVRELRAFARMAAAAADGWRRAEEAEGNA